MKVLVTGAAGFLGSHICEELLVTPWRGDIEVFGIDNLSGGDIDNVPVQMLDEGTFVVADCCEYSDMLQYTADVDVVIHCAANPHEGLSVFSPLHITRNIFDASVSVMSAAIANKVKRFVFCSSMARYGEQQPPFVESMTPAPVDPYGISKVAAEDVLKTLCKVHGMEWNIAVPHNIIGPKQNYTDPYRNVASIMINRNLRGLPSIIYGDGQQVRCFSYVAECVEAIIKMALDPLIVSEVINIGPDKGEMTIEQLADIIGEITGNEEPHVFIDPRPQEVFHATCSSDKARTVLGYKETIDVREALEKTAEWIKKRGPKPFEYALPLEIVTDKTPNTWKEQLM